MQQPNVLLLDEPTNDLDISTLTVLEDYIDNFNGTVITVSHDRYFLDKVATDLLIFDGNAKIERYTGLFTDYLQDHLSSKKSNTQKTSSNQPKSKKTKDTTKKSSSKKTKLTYKEKLEWKDLEPALDKLDQQIKEVQNEMAANGSNYDKLADLQKQLDQLNQESDTKMKRWEYLSQFVDNDQLWGVKNEY